MSSLSYCIFFEIASDFWEFLDFISFFWDFVWVFGIFGISFGIFWISLGSLGFTCFFGIFSISLGFLRFFRSFFDFSEKWPGGAPTSVSLLRNHSRNGATFPARMQHIWLP